MAKKNDLNDYIKNKIAEKKGTVPVTRAKTRPRHFGKDKIDGKQLQGKRDAGEKGTSTARHAGKGKESSTKREVVVRTEQDNVPSQGKRTSILNTHKASGASSLSTARLTEGGSPRR